MLDMTLLSTTLLSVLLSASSSDVHVGDLVHLDEDSILRDFLEARGFHHKTVLRGGQLQKLETAIRVADRFHLGVGGGIGER
jgi:hypothetical protein